MATQTKKCSFNGPCIGTVHPKGSRIKKNPDGTVTVIEPKKKKKKRND